MHMPNGRTAVIGREATQSTGFYGVGKLADTTVGPDGLPITINTPSTVSGCVNGYDEFGVACTDFTPITSNPVSTALALNYLNTPTQVTAPVASGINMTYVAIGGAALLLVIL